MKLGTILLLILGIGLVSGGFAFDVITDFGTCRVFRLCFVYPLFGTSFDLSPLIVFLGLWPIVHVILELTEKKGDIPPIEKPP